MVKINHKNNELAGLISDLKKLSIEKEVKIWKRIANDLEKATRNRRIVNIYKLNKYTKDNDFVIIPGKVLGTGDLTHSVDVAAFSFSDDASKKISEKGKIFTIREIMKKNPEGKNIKIIG